MRTTAEKKQDTLLALDILESNRADITSGNGLVLMSAEYGKGVTDYFRVILAYTNKDGRTDYAHLTWAIAQICGYSLRDRGGYYFLAVGGGGYSKTDAIADSLARHYGMKRIRYERN